MAPESPNGLIGSDVMVVVRRHLQVGWWSVLGFLSLGIFLEAMHGFKVEWYVDPAFETRRLMWTLGHAHGTLLGLVQIAYAVTLSTLGDAVPQRRETSTSLIVGGLLIPAGFLSGGIFIYEGDPGFGILLVPVGAASLLLGVLLAAWSVTKTAGTDPRRSK